MFISLCRIGGNYYFNVVNVVVSVKYHSENEYHSRCSFFLSRRKVMDNGLCNVVSLTGAVAFKKVTKVRIRQIHLDSDPK